MILALVLFAQLADPVGTSTPLPEPPVSIAFPEPTPAPRPDPLFAISPECRRATGERARACRAARTILSLDPPRATAFYLAHWSGTSLGQPACLSHDGVGLYPCSEPKPPDPTDDLRSLGNFLLVTTCVGGVIAEGVESNRQLARVREHGLITTRALEHVYETSPDPYSRRMLGQLARVNYGLESTFEALLAVHADALGTTVEELTKVPPLPPPSAASAIVPDALYRPTGHGPDVFAVRGGGAVVVQAGDHIRVTRRDGTKVHGKVVAVSPRGIALRDARGEIVVLAVDVETIRRE